MEERFLSCLLLCNYPLVNSYLQLRVVATFVIIPHIAQNIIAVFWVTAVFYNGLGAHHFALCIKAPLAGVLVACAAEVMGLTQWAGQLLVFGVAADVTHHFPSAHSSKECRKGSRISTDLILRVHFNNVKKLAAEHNSIREF